MADEPGAQARPDDPPEPKGGLSRRALLAGGAGLGAGLVAGGAVASVAVLGLDEDDTTTVTEAGAPVTQLQTVTADAEPAAEATATTDHTEHEQPAQASGSEPYQVTTLTAAQGAALVALVDRLAPADDLGPSASEMGVVRFIDRALSSDPNQALFYADGLDALDAYSADQGGAFAALEGDAQDEILRALEAGEATGFAPSSSAFFEAVREHTLQGMFGDPYYGGNIGGAGWSLIGFPGVRLAISEDEQAVNAEQQTVAGSVYDLPAFGIERKEA